MSVDDRAPAPGTEPEGAGPGPTAPGDRPLAARAEESTESEALQAHPPGALRAQDDTPSFKELLSIRDFRLLWLGQIVSNFGDAVTGLAAFILINHLTDGSTTALAMAAILQALPRMTVGLVAGVFVDRLDRKLIMIVADLLRALLVLGLILVDTRDRLWLLYVLSFLLASVSSFFMPARTAYIPLVVPKRALLAANSISQSSMIIVGVLGAGAAGVMIDRFDTYWPAFMIDALTFLVSAAFLIRVLTPAGGKVETRAGVRPIVDEMMAGFGVLASSRILGGVLAAMAVTMLGLGMVNVLLVPLVLNDLQIGETWFAVLQLSQSSSMVLSGALLAVLAARFRPTNIVSVALVATGFAVGLMSQVTNVWGLILVLFGVGWFITPLQASLMTLLQANVTDEMRGRAGAALSTSSQTAGVVSMAAAGVLADAIGVRGVFVLGGSLTVVAGLLSAVIFRGQVPGPQPQGSGY